LAGVSLPLVAIVGAPNVGKSTLFNRLVRQRRAIVTDEPGVTRDRMYGEVDLGQRTVRLVDTGGLTPDLTEPFAEDIGRQAEKAMDEAACLLFVVDARAGITALDRDVALRLRRRGTPIVLVANKVDTPQLETLTLALFELGLGEPQPVSAEHSLGIGELLQRVDDALARAQPHAPGANASDEERVLSVAIVGRPNVGKSSLLNRLVGEERALVSEIPGTTRDAVDTLLEVGPRRYRLIDTAGLRRRGRPATRAERFSVARARRNIESCDVAVLLLDATRPFGAQDAHIAGYVSDVFKPLIVGLNKWDLVEEREHEAKRLTEEVHERLRFAKQAPVLLLSALTGQRAARVLELASELDAAGAIRVSTPELNRWLQDLGMGQGESAPGGARFYYSTQTGIHPPSFLLFCNDPRRVHFSLRRRMENSLRERFGFGGSPIRLRLRARRD
jgi:GTP-binding protein